MQLAIQILAAFLLVVLMVLIHGLGVVWIARLLRIEDGALRAHRIDYRAFGLATSMALGLFAIHAIEIGVFALFYLLTGALHTLEEALYFSASSYTTLGHPDLDFPLQWRLLGAIEGLVGFLMIGWSTAVFVTDMSKLLRK